MLLTNHLPHPETEKIRIACAYLFSPEQANDDGFLRQLDLETVEKAFVRKEKRYNPYINRNEPREMRQKRARRLTKIKDSYRVLKAYILEKEKKPVDQGRTRGKIIAVGGAKGGIGKSIFTTNLGVLLASRGKKTVLVDLDLGGANLQYYLGKKSIKHSIDDFLNKQCDHISDLAESTDYGPDLIGEGNSQLGSANLPFARKLKLLKSIRTIDADFIILDLGGDTTFNIIDFFLAADMGLVLTSCEPASYVSAYNFIKIAFQRKLNRIAGAESEFRKQADSDLRDLIQDVIATSNQNGGNFLTSLNQRVKQELPEHERLLTEVVASFKPRLVVNMVDEGVNADAVVRRIQEVAEKMLSVQVTHLGSVPFASEVKNSALDLVPLAAKYPQSDFSNAILKISEGMLKVQAVG